MRILVVEDEPTLAAQLAEGVREAGYAVDVAHNGLDAHFMGDTEPFDAVVLDLGLPQMDGITVLKKWRAAGRTMPVLILTARDNWHEKVAGIDAGADDYLTKPFQMAELLARLRAIIRRSTGQANPVLQIGDIAIDTRTNTVSRAGLPVDLTPLEYRCLAYLAHNRDRNVTQIELTEQLYAQDFERDSNSVEVLIGRLRKKLGKDAISTRRGYGYRIGGDES